MASARATRPAIEDLGRSRMPAIPRNFVARLALFGIAWCIGLELLTRLFLVSPSNVVPDPTLGSKYAPNSTVLIETPDAGFLRVSFNEFGFNDGPLAPGDHRRRILVLGDSYVEAFQLPRTQNFLGIMGRDRPDLRFVNGARSGLDPVTESLMLEKLAPLIRPARVIILVNSGDPADMLADGITVRRCTGTQGICDYTLRPIPPLHRSRLAGLLSGRSALLTYLLRRFQQPIDTQWAHLRGRLSPNARPGAATRAPGAYAAKDFEPLLALVFRRIAQRYGLIVVAVPDLQFESAGRSAAADGGAFEKRVGAAALKAGAVFFDAGPALMSAYARSGQPPNGFAFRRPGTGHLNAEGHAAVAHGLERYLGAFGGAAAG